MSERGRSRPSWILVVVVVVAIAVIVLVKHTAKSGAASASKPAARQATVKATAAPSRQPEGREPESSPVPAPTTTKAAPPVAPAAGVAARSPSPPARQPQAGTAPTSAPNPPSPPKTAPTPSAAPTAPPPEQPKKAAEPLPGSKFEDSLKSGRPTMADFGAGWCKPCKMMVPVLAEAAGRYEGKVNILFVDTNEYGPLARQHRVAAIPTQIFFDGKGKEVGRHVGYYPIEDLEAQMRTLGLTK